MIYRINLIVTFCFLSLAICSTSTAQIESFWNGGSSGGWNQNGNWLPIGYPDNTPVSFYEVFVDNDPNTDTTITVDLPSSFPVEVDSLTIDVGDTVHIIDDFTRLTVVKDASRPNSGQLVNSGDIIIESTSNTFAALSVESECVISGGGTITLRGTGAAALTGFPIESLGVRNIDNTIQGKGNLGTGSLALVNEAAAVIDANDPSGPLVVIPRANESFDNMGLIQASNGGELVLVGIFENHGGTITARNNSKITLGQGLNGANIFGGDLTTTGTGCFEVPIGCASQFEDVDCSAPVTVGNNALLQLVGGIVNQSEIVVQNSGAVTRIEVSGQVTLSGNGVITLAGSTDNSVIGSGDNQLTNVNNLIRGKGRISDLHFKNSGEVNANDSSGTLTLEAAAKSPIANDGMFIASSGGNLRISGMVDNSDGVIESQNGSTVSFVSASISNGTIQSFGSGIFDSVFDVTMLNGTRIVPGNSVGTMNMTGDFTFGNMSVVEIEIEGSSSFDIVDVAGDLNLSGDLMVSVSGFTPAPGETFAVVKASSLNGDFMNVAPGGTLATSDGSGHFVVNYGPTSNFDPDHVVLSNFQMDILLGDLNGDGFVNLLDIAPFVEAISEGIFIPAADINQDGVVNLLDVGPFIEILAG